MLCVCACACVHSWAAFSFVLFFFTSATLRKSNISLLGQLKTSENFFVNAVAATVMDCLCDKQAVR